MNNQDKNTIDRLVNFITLLIFCIMTIIAILFFGIYMILGCLFGLLLSFFLWAREEIRQYLKRKD